MPLCVTLWHSSLLGKLAKRANVGLCSVLDVPRSLPKQPPPDAQPQDLRHLSHNRPDTCPDSGTRSAVPDHWVEPRLSAFTWKPRAKIISRLCNCLSHRPFRGISTPTTRTVAAKSAIPEAKMSRSCSLASCSESLIQCNGWRLVTILIQNATRRRSRRSSTEKRRSGRDSLSSSSLQRTVHHEQRTNMQDEKLSISPT